MAHTDQLAGDVGKDKTIANMKRFFLARHVQMDNPVNPDYLTVKKNKHKHHNLNKAHLEQWTDTVPFPYYTVHIDHRD